MKKYLVRKLVFSAALASTAALSLLTDAHAEASYPWLSIDQTQWVRDANLYDYDRNEWNAGNLPEQAPASRFIGINQPGGPRVPEELLANPDLYTYEASLQGVKNEKRGLKYYVGHGIFKPILQTFLFPGPGRDEVPPMPVELVRKLETYLQPGDLILQSNDILGQKEMERNNLGHAMLYIGNGLIVHSIGVARDSSHGSLGTAVYVTHWETAIQRDLDGADRLAILRPKYMFQSDYNAFVEYAVRQVGKPYDFGIDTSSARSFYCTELPYHVFRRLPHPTRILPDKEKPLNAITGNSYMNAMDDGEFDLVLVINPKMKADRIIK